MTYLHQSPEFSLDPIQEVEDIGGTPEQGLRMAFMLNRIRRMNAIDAGDTTMGDSLERYLNIATREGFELIAQVPFICTSNPREPKQETLFVFYHPTAHAVLSVESYNGATSEARVNMANMYFVVKPQGDMKEKTNQVRSHMWGGAWESEQYPNWRRDPQFYQNNKTSFPDDIVYVGNVDVRDCLVSHLKAIKALNPQVRPIGDVFEVMEAIGVRQDYIDSNGNNRVDYKLAHELRKRRLKSLDVSPAIFGVSHKK